jgi:hypothetical protein
MIMNVERACFCTFFSCIEYYRGCFMLIAMRLGSSKTRVSRRTIVACRVDGMKFFTHARDCYFLNSHFNVEFKTGYTNPQNPSWTIYKKEQAMEKTART